MGPTSHTMMMLMMLMSSSIGRSTAYTLSASHYDDVGEMTGSNAQNIRPSRQLRDRPWRQLQPRSHRSRYRAAPRTAVGHITSFSPPIAVICRNAPQCAAMCPPPKSLSKHGQIYTLCYNVMFKFDHISISSSVLGTLRRTAAHCGILRR